MIFENALTITVTIPIPPFLPLERETMSKPTSRREFLASTSMLLPACLRSPTLLHGDEVRPVETATISNGDLKALVRDNSQSPKVLSGIDSLFHTMDAPNFDAYDPDSPGASAGLNFEHIISGHKNKNNAFTPRHGKYDLFASPDGSQPICSTMPITTSSSTPGATNIRASPSRFTLVGRATAWYSF